MTRLYTHIYYFISLSCLVFPPLEAIRYEVYVPNAWATVHVLKLDPEKERLEIVRAEDELHREPVADMAKRHGAIAGVNGGFWTKEGLPAGLLRIDGDWFGVTKKFRGAVAWSDGGRTASFDRATVSDQLITELDQDEEFWRDADYLLGGTPLLVRDGEKVENFDQEQVLDSFLYQRHARTAVGRLANGQWVLVVVEGRFCGLTGGLTIPELVQWMWSFGCTDALNLDGGSSSTFWLKGKVRNRSCLGIAGSRPVTDAILVLPRAP